MPLVAVTRLRVRSWRFLPVFAWHTWRSSRQARSAAGNLGVAMRKANGLAFWTATVWKDRAAMNAFRNAPPHGAVMPKLLEWCDEASLVDWEPDSSAMPNWPAAELRMAESGRLSKVHHPSRDQQIGRLDFRLKARSTKRDSSRWRRSACRIVKGRTVAGNDRPTMLAPLISCRAHKSRIHMPGQVEDRILTHRLIVNGVACAVTVRMKDGAYRARWFCGACSNHSSTSFTDSSVAAMVKLAADDLEQHVHTVHG
jgi:hypothetical protein